MPKYRVTVKNPDSGGRIETTIEAPSIVDAAASATDQGLEIVKWAKHQPESGLDRLHAQLDALATLSKQTRDLDQILVAIEQQMPPRTVAVQLDRRTRKFIRKSIYTGVAWGIIYAIILFVLLVVAIYIFLPVLVTAILSAAASGGGLMGIP